MCNKLGTPCLFQKQKQEHSPLKGTLITQAVSLEIMSWMHQLGFPAGSVVKNLPGQRRRHRLDPWIWKIPCRRKWQPSLVFLPGKSHGQSLGGYSPWGRKESVRHSWSDWACMHVFPFSQTSRNSGIAQTAIYSSDSLSVIRIVKAYYIMTWRNMCRPA